MIIIKLLSVWFVMVVCAILNGTLRDKVLNYYIGENVALAVSGIFLSFLVFLVLYVAIDHFSNKSIFVYICMGIFLLSLTLAFEYGFGHYVLGKSWSEINKVFEIKNGNFFVLVLLTTLFGPLLSARIKSYV